MAQLTPHPPIENHAKAIQLAVCASLLIHGLAFAGLAFVSPGTSVAPAPDDGISIELDQPFQMARVAPQSSSPEETPATPASLPKKQERTLTEAAPVPREAPPTIKEATPKKQPPVRKKTKVESQKKTGREAVQPRGEKIAENRAPQAGAPAKSTQGQPAASGPVPLITESTPKPQYPELARKRGQQGLVRVLCEVDAAGNVRAAKVSLSSGHKLLDEAALKTVRKWRFKPAMSKGMAVAGTVVVPVEFKLR